MCHLHDMNRTNPVISGHFLQKKVNFWLCVAPQKFNFEFSAKKRNLHFLVPVMSGPKKSQFWIFHQKPKPSLFSTFIATCLWKKSEKSNMPPPRKNLKSVVVFAKKSLWEDIFWYSGGGVVLYLF